MHPRETSREAEPCAQPAGRAFPRRQADQPVSVLLRHDPYGRLRAELLTDPAAGAAGVELRQAHGPPPSRPLRVLLLHQRCQHPPVPHPVLFCLLRKRQALRRGSQGGSCRRLSCPCKEASPGKTLLFRLPGLSVGRFRRFPAPQDLDPLGVLLTEEGAQRVQILLQAAFPRRLPAGFAGFRPQGDPPVHRVHRQQLPGQARKAAHRHIGAVLIRPAGKYQGFPGGAFLLDQLPRRL